MDKDLVNFFRDFLESMKESPVDVLQDKHIQLARQGADSYIAALEDIGWFSGHSAEYKERVLSEVRGSSPECYMEALSVFPFLKYETGDTELIKSMLEVMLPQARAQEHRIPLPVRAKAEVLYDGRTYTHLHDLPEQGDWFAYAPLQHFVEGVLRDVGLLDRLPCASIIADFARSRRASRGRRYEINPLGEGLDGLIYLDVLHGMLELSGIPAQSISSSHIRRSDRTAVDVQVGMRTYHYPGTSTEGPWDPDKQQREIIAFLNKMLEAEGLSHRFRAFNYSEDDDTGCMICVPPWIYDRAVQVGVITQKEEVYMRWRFSGCE